MNRRRSRNRYRNRLGASKLARFLLVGGLFATVGVVYVSIKNKRVMLEKDCARLEREIAIVQQQISGVEEDIIEITGRDSLVERLQRAASNLDHIDLDRLVTVNKQGDAVPSLIAEGRRRKGGEER